MELDIKKLLPIGFLIIAVIFIMKIIKGKNNCKEKFVLEDAKKALELIKKIKKENSKEYSFEPPSYSTKIINVEDNSELEDDSEIETTETPKQI